MTIIFDKKKHDQVIDELKCVIKYWNGDRLRMDSEIISYFSSFFHAAMQADLLDKGYLNGAKKFPYLTDMSPEELDSWKQEVNKVYALWIKHCGFWRSFRIANIVGRHREKYALMNRLEPGSIPRKEVFLLNLQSYYAGYILSQISEDRD